MLITFDAQRAYKAVWALRHDIGHIWLTPNKRDALRYVVQESAEVLDAWMRENLPQHRRNHVKEMNVKHELADQLMMWLTAIGPNYHGLTRAAVLEINCDDAPDNDNVAFMIEDNVAEAAYILREYDMIDGEDIISNAIPTTLMIASYYGWNDMNIELEQTLARIAEKHAGIKDWRYRPES